MAGPNLSEIARRLKLSKTTVSRVFNNVPNSGISPTTRTRVMTAIREMGYEPNLSARALAVGRTHVIAAMMVDVNNPFASGYVSAVEEFARQQGYHVLLCNTRGSWLREREEARMLRRRGVEGLIIEHIGPAEPLRELKKEGFPFVLLDRCPEDPGLDYVTFDDVEGGRLATRALLDVGRRRIACVTGPTWSLPAADRLQGYRQALAEAGLQYQPELVVVGERYDEPTGRAAGEKLLDLPDPPTGVSCADDQMALGVYRAAVARGLRVPEDVALVGYNDSSFCPCMAVPLASVRLDTDRLGREAATMLLEKIERGPEPSPRAILIPPELVRRASLG